jgi:hypothetical protein
MAVLVPQQAAAIARPRVRRRDREKVPLPSWGVARSEDRLGKWAMNLMLINLSTRKCGRPVRLPDEHGSGRMCPIVAADDRAR